MLEVFLRDLTGTGAIISGIAALIAAFYARRTGRQMQPGSDKSLFDKIGVIEDKVDTIETFVMGFGHQVDSVRKDLSNLRSDLTRVDRRIDNFFDNHI